MKITTRVKAGSLTMNHNATVKKGKKGKRFDVKRVRGGVIKTGVKAGLTMPESHSK